MNQITINDNKWCSLVLLDNPEIVAKLKKHLSYKMVGVEYTQAYKNGWDGITYMIDKKGRFALGLLPRVESFLANYDVKYTLVDKRQLAPLGKEIPIIDTLQAMGKPPRDYQLETLNATILNRKGIIRGACGAGKTMIGALITAKLNVPTIIYVIGLDLLQQFHQVFTEVLKQPIGFIGNGVCDIQQINIASIWTVGKALDIKFKILDEEIDVIEEDINIVNKLKIQELLKKTQLNIFDECHAASCETFREIYKFIDPIFIYGMSATPSRGDGQDLYIESILGKYIAEIPASHLIERGILAQPIIKFVNVPKMAISSKNYQSVYSEYVINNEIRNQLVLRETLKLIEKKYKILVIFKNISHGNYLSKLFKEKNIRFALLSGKDNLEKRSIVKSQIENNEIDVILGSKIFNIGVDIPILSALVLADGGKSLVACTQKLGRILRSYPGKRIAAVVDFYDDVRFLKQHSIVRYNLYKTEKGFTIMPNIFLDKS